MLFTILSDKLLSNRGRLYTFCLKSVEEFFMDLQPVNIRALMQGYVIDLPSRGAVIL